jgi:RHS repeat-associated protein
MGRLATAANGTDTLTWVYDLAGQLTSEASTFNSSTVSYTYDNDGNRSTLSLNGTQFTSYGYDDASRLTSITQGTNVFGFGYDNANRRTSLTYPNGISTAYTYDALSKLTNISATLGANTITQWGYTYDNAGNRLTKTSPDYSETYTYDSLYRLTQAVRTSSSVTNHWVWTYDAMGNRLTNQLDDTVSTSTYNSSNQIQTGTGGGPLVVRGHLNKAGTATVNGLPAEMLSGNVFQSTIQTTPGVNTFRVIATDVSGNVTNQNYQVTLSGTSDTYTQDADGNLTQKVEGSNTFIYAWDAENRLKSVTQNGTTIASFAFDPKGRRVQKVAGGVSTSFLYDGGAILQQTSGSTALKFLHGSGIDEPMANLGASGALTFYHADGLGSVVKNTNSSGTVTSTYQYDPWGNIQTGATQGGYAFTGREWDPETGLYYYRARYYDPAAAHFLGDDPLGFDGGMNRYSYVLDNPTDFRDPLGWFPVGPIGIEYFKNIACAQTELTFYLNSPIYSSGRPRYNHCMMSCRIKKHCGSLTSAAAGIAKEVLMDTPSCLKTLHQGTCDSAMQPVDFRDDYYGVTCPKNQSCKDRCRPLRDVPDGPPGPFHYWPTFVNSFGGE